MPGADLVGGYGPLEAIARNRVNVKKVITHWPDMLRVAGSLVTNQVRAYDLLRMFGREGNPTPLGAAFAEYGRIAKPLHLLAGTRIRMCSAATTSTPPSRSTGCGPCVTRPRSTSMTMMTARRTETLQGPTDGSGRCYGGFPGPYRGMSIRTRPRPPASTRSWALAMSASG